MDLAKETFEYAKSLNRLLARPPDCSTCRHLEEWDEWHLYGDRRVPEHMALCEYELEPEDCGQWEARG